jgi:hypothetical protein
MHGLRPQVPPTLVSTLLKTASPSTSPSRQPGAIPKGKPSKKFFREQEYLEQLPMTRDHPPNPYADAIRKVYSLYPNDAEVVYFFAEALMVMNAW